MVSTDKPTRVHQHLINSGADFAIVTETHTTDDTNPWATIPRAHFSSFKRKQRGCAVIPLRKGVAFTDVIADPEGRFILATAHTLTFCGAYAPNENQADFIENILEIIPPSCTMLAGDFNIVTRLTDRLPPKELSDESIRFLNATTRAGFRDPTRNNSPHSFIYRNGRYTARLDRCLVRDSPHFSAVSSSLHRYPSSCVSISDHVPVLFHLLTPEPIPRGSPFWRLNTNRLAQTSLDALNGRLYSLAPPSLPALPLWETTKRAVRTFFCTHRKRPKYHVVGFSGEHPTSDSSDPLAVAFNKSLLLRRVSADKAKELPSPMLSSLIKSNISENHIPAVKTPSGDTDYTQEGISNSFRTWFESLFTPKPSSITPLHRHIPRLPARTAEAISAPITREDIMEAASSTKKNSAPGIDGIPYVVYARVPYLAELLSRALRQIFDTARCKLISAARSTDLGGTALNRAEVDCTYRHELLTYTALFRC